MYFTKETGDTVLLYSSNYIFVDFVVSQIQINMISILPFQTKYSLLIVAFTVVHFKSQTYHSSHDGVYMQHYVFKKSLYSVPRYICSTFSSIIQYLKYLRVQTMFVSSMKKSQDFSFEMHPHSCQVSIHG